MRLLFTSRFFIGALALVLLQQIFVGISTYCIGLAGGAIAESALPLLEIALFFGFIFLAYIPGGFSGVFLVKAANRIWEKYYQKILQSLTNKVPLHSSENRDITNALITTEANTAINDACNGWHGLVAVICNVLFNSVAIGLVVNPGVAVLLVGTFIAGVIVIQLVNSRIKSMATEIQKSKSHIIQAIYYGWDNVMFGSPLFRNSLQQHLHQKVQPYFKATELYEWFEMIIANVPVMLSIATLTLFSWKELSQHPGLLGAYIAILPRTIQIFQYMHAITMHTSRLLLLQTRLHKLQYLTDQLNEIPRDQRISFEKLRLIYGQKTIDLKTALAEPSNAFGSLGRYQLYGSNGSGKSSYLMMLKEIFGDEAVMIGPGIELGTGEYNQGSCGENTLAIVAALADTDARMILLDEWNANLDPVNYAKVDALLSLIAENKIIVEATPSGTI